jgi:hypothetical protein
MPPCRTCQTGYTVDDNGCCVANVSPTKVGDCTYSGTDMGWYC